MASFQEAENYINEIPRFAGKNSVEDTARLLFMAGCDRLPAKIVHVAGTNGKGSVCSYLASILKQVGFRVGRFTSPHLQSICERISMDDRQITEEEFVSVYEKVKDLSVRSSREGLSHPSFFEYLFLMAMIYFKEQGPDVILLETGLGGRLDATNSIKKPDVCVITEIGYDHMQYLGDSLEKIAGEKAGIIKKGVPVVFPDKRPEVTGILSDYAKKMDSPVILLEKDNILDVNIGNKSIDFSLYTRYYNYVSLCISTKAVYQPENAALSVLAAHVLCEKLDPEAVRKGLFTAYWPGRMEEALPGVFLDGAHNEDGVQAFLDSVRRDGCKGKRSLLFGVVADKRYDRMIEMIASAGLFAKVIVASLSTDRSTSLEQMKEVWGRYEGVSCSFFESVQAGFEQQLQLKEAEDTAYVAGSLYLIGQVKSLIRRTQDDRF